MLAKISNLRIISPLFIITFFALVCYAIFASPPQSKRNAVKLIAPSVGVVTTKPMDHPVTIAAQGLIIAPHRAISLMPQVSGLIVNTHQNFIPGGLIPAGNHIVQIEQTDFKILLNEAQAKLSLAIASLTIEQGRQRLAKKEFALNDTNFVDDGENKALALRAPQLKQAQAKVQLAKNDVSKAQISLQRTNLSLPYDARVLSITTTTGEFIGLQKTIAVLTKANERWLELKFPAKYIDRLRAKTAKSKGSLVTFTLNNKSYQGEVISLLADLVNSTKMSGAIVEVKSLNPNADQQYKTSLIIGTHISATIAAGIINKAYSIPRRSFINNKQVYVVDKNQQLQSRIAALKWEFDNKAIVDIDLEENDQIVTNQIFGIVPGSKVNAIEQVKL
jgi:multidrug efflux pump subunit AcrA (membrane-fusion protein)